MLTRPTPDEARRHAAGSRMISPSPRSSSAAMGDSLPPIDRDGKVVRFRTSSRKKPDLPRWNGLGQSNVIDLRSRHPALRKESGLPEWHLREWSTTSKSLIEDIEKYQYASETDDDDRHRMAVNALAAGVLILLMIIGEWAVITLAQAT
jgi:hypothetical protein